jgi:hypothetical protein
MDYENVENTEIFWLKKLLILITLEILPIYGSTALLGLCRFFSFLISTQSVWLLGRGSARRKAATYTENNTNTE